LNVTDTRKSRVRWLLVFWMFVISAVAYVDRVNISIAGPTIAREFGLDNIHLGWVFSAFLAGYALFQTPGGGLADRIGPRLVIALGVIWWAIFTSLVTVLSPGIAGLFVWLIALRFGLGLGEAVVYPASNCMIASWIPSDERGVANGIIFAGVGFGAGITPPFIAWLMLHYGWRSSFWGSAVLGLAAGAIWYTVARDNPRQHPAVSGSELTHIEQGLPEAEVRGEKNRLPWRAILSDGNVLAVSFSYFTYGYAAYIFFSWFFIYLNTVRKLDVRHSSYYTMLPFMAMAVASPLGGWISDVLVRRHGRRVGRCYTAFAAMAACAVFIAVGSRVANAQIASVVLAGGAGALYLSQSAFWAVSADIGKRSAGSVSGFMNMCSQIGGAVTASLTPWIASHWGWTASFMTAAALCALGALAWLAVIPGRSGSPANAAAPGAKILEHG
jgi:ACS family glucarate transporter-like MFS transporter